MSQIFTDNCYDSTHQVATDMAAIENNFAALKSMFSGASAPSDMVAGMLWFDTTVNLLKLRNEANDAWLSVWDLANNKPVVTNVVSADFAAAMKDAAVGTASLRTLGTGAAQALPGNHDYISGHGVQLFTSSGTWTRPSGVTAARVVAVGGGGGGGGAGPFSGGGGGGRGGIIEKICTITGDVTVTIGSGGAGGAVMTVGSTGGTSSFGSLCAGTGGAGGAGGGGAMSEPGAGGAAGSYSGSGSSVSAYLEPGYTGTDPTGGTGGGNYWGTIYGYGGNGGTAVNGSGNAGVAGYILVMW